MIATFAINIIGVIDTAFGWEIPLFSLVLLPNFFDDMSHFFVIFKNIKFHRQVDLFVAYKAILGTFYFFGLKGFHIFLHMRTRTAYQNDNP